MTICFDHLDSSSRRSRSLASMHRRNALRSVIGPVSCRLRRGFTLKHDRTLTLRRETNLQISATSSDVRTLSIQKIAFLMISPAAAMSPPSACQPSNNDRRRALSLRQLSFLFSFISSCFIYCIYRAVYTSRLSCFKHCRSAL